MAAKEPFILRIRLRRDELDATTWPMTLPAVRGIENLRFDTPVTVIAGENGAGKSTVIEAIAEAAGFNPEGGRKTFQTGGGTTCHALANALTLVRGARREQDGFFLRAESAYVIMSYLNEIGGQHNYGGNLHSKSHGESFFQILNSRFRSTRNALFIFDEIESALSPQRQLELLALMNQHVQRGSAFIISTHSPILMSFPGSRLYWLDQEGVSERDWRDTEHFRVYQGFINRPETIHRILFEKES